MPKQQQQSHKYRAQSNGFQAAVFGPTVGAAVGLRILLAANTCVLQVFLKVPRTGFEPVIVHTA
jgi:hypothetical protein